MLTCTEASHTCSTVCWTGGFSVQDKSWPGLAATSLEKYGTLKNHDEHTEMASAKAVLERKVCQNIMEIEIGKINHGKKKKKRKNKIEISSWEDTF